ncbi:glycosyltransferase family 9 protein [Granulicella tundricola]|nr:glycosyltransferase family 9 protein [Granulicella tundricola]
MAKRVKRVLIYRLGSLGDTVVALPALHLIARAFPGAERKLLTNFPINDKAPAAAAVLGKSGLVAGYFRYTVGMRNPFALLRLWFELIRWRPQVLVYLAAARGVSVAKRDSLFFKVCGIPRQVGVPLTDVAQRNTWLGDELGYEPECERLVRNISELGDAEIDRADAWDLRLSIAERARGREMLAAAKGRPLIMFSIGTKLQANDWGKERWRALMVEMGRQYRDHALVFTGVKGESETSEFVAEGWRESAGEDSPVVNLCGKLSPRESAACFAQAQVFLGHDSGPMHLAAAIGAPVVAIFSARNLPRMWFPYGKQHRVIYHEVSCMGCGLERCVVEQKRCLTSIGVDEVVEAVREVLGERVGAGR